MDFDPPLLEGRLLRRYKRFLADIRLNDGREITAHCANTGSMRGCADPDSRVWVSHHADPKRKLAYSWQLVETAEADLACINTALPNRLVGEWLEGPGAGDWGRYRHRRSEVRYGQERSRIDWLLEDHPDGRAAVYLEVKNVTLAGDGIGYFPDAVTQRGQKHLRELISVVGSGARALLFFCVNHSGVTEVRPADHIDPVYGRLLREAVAAGVELLAVRSAISPQRIQLEQEVEVLPWGR